MQKKVFRVGKSFLRYPGATIQETGAQGKEEDSEEAEERKMKRHASDVKVSGQ